MDPSRRGLMLGILGVLVFSLTMPMTKIALAGDAMSPWFAWAGRAVLAGFAGIAYLVSIGARRPPREALWPLVGTTTGVVFGWPLLNTIALQSVPASHAAVVNGILPLATAIIGAYLNRERLSRRFWLCAVGGTVTVCAYAWQRASGSLHLTDSLMLIAVVLGGLGYACGALAARHMSGPEVISWALLFGLPATLVLLAFNLPQDIGAISLRAWAAFAYLGLMSQWVGFFFWYRGLLLGGIAKVSQVQLTQLFLTLGFSALLLAEAIEPAMLIVAGVTIALIVIGRRKSIAVRRVNAAV